MRTINEHSRQRERADIGATADRIADMAAAADRIADMAVLADRIADISAHIDAATHRLLTCIREFDEADGWWETGALSCAKWLSWRVGLAPAAAREKVRVARRLGELPAIDAALASGELSYSKVRALTRVADAENEDMLLGMALVSTAAQLEKICRLYRQTRSLDPTDPRADADRRWITSRWTDDGMVQISARLHPDEAARVLAAIDACADTGDRADGLVSLADQRVRGEAPDRSPVEVTLCVDAASLEGTLGDGTGVSAETSRRLLCDAGIVPLLEDEHGHTLNVGRRSRTIPTSIKRAMLRRDDSHCRFPGCDNRRWLDGHHVEHWIDDGHTTLGNLVSLCRGHHRLVHESGFAISATDDGGFLFSDAHGTPVPGSGRLPLAPEAMARLRRWVRDDGAHVDARTNDPRWDGTPPQYELIIDTLNAVSPP